MSNSSQLTTSLDDLLKDITIDLSKTSVGASEYSYTYDTNNMSTITLSPSITSFTTSAGGAYSIGSGISTISIDNSSFNWQMPVEWADSFPEWARVKDMCKKYPGLEIAFRNFKTVYELVKDDYDNPTPKK